MKDHIEIKKYCYNKWLNSRKTWNHYLTSKLLEKQLLKQEINNL